MPFNNVIIAFALILAGLVSPISGAAEGGPLQLVANGPRVVQVGPGQIRVGRILVDKNKGSFVVPGRVARLAGPDVPLEFIAVSIGGTRAYESLLELDAGPTDFNLACILLGLEKDPRGVSKFHFDPAPVRGHSVAIDVSWNDGREQRNAAVSEWLRGAPVNAGGSENWVYTGSLFTADGRYLPSLDGTLIGFVHDPASIIDHGPGMGLGDYGAVTANNAIRPAPGTRVLLRVTRVD